MPIDKTDISNATSGLLMMNRQIKAMKPSLWSEWNWATNGFEQCAEWLQSHHNIIRRGTYISHTPGKEIWKFRLPKKLGGRWIVYRYYDYSQADFFKKFMRSAAYHCAVNIAFMDGIGISTCSVLACGEIRKCGLLQSAYIVMDYIEDIYDGSVLTPSGMLIDNSILRMAFGFKIMENFAKLHSEHFTLEHFHAHTIVFPKDTNEIEPKLIWIDPSNYRLQHRFNERKIIPTELVHFFVELRYDTDQIKTLCEHYLKFNKHCGFTPNSLWKAMLAVKH